MSEKILETLMQLFAIIAKPENNIDEKRGVVEAFLRHHLNHELLQKYLSIYDKEFDEARKKLIKRGPERREGAIAVRISKLCKDINEQGQLDHEQRIVVLIRVLEFCKSGGHKVSKRESDFIDVLKDGLNILSDEYDCIEKFVLNSFTDIPSIPNFLIINGIRDFETKVQNIL